MNQQFKELLQKEMTRHEFLTVLGLCLASVFGLSSILRILNASNAGKSSGRASSLGYGSGGYGR
jgi:hypothetical protein